METDLNNSESKPKIEDKRLREVRPMTLNYIFYPPGTIAQSCLNIPALENITFELKPQYAHMLPKFTGVLLTSFYESLKRFVPRCVTLMSTLIRRI